MKERELKGIPALEEVQIIDVTAKSLFFRTFANRFVLIHLEH